MQINEKRMRKHGPKKVCGIERKEAKIEFKSEPEIVNILKNARKKASKNRYEKKCRTDPLKQRLGTEPGPFGF